MPAFASAAAVQAQARAALAMEDCAAMMAANHLLAALARQPGHAADADLLEQLTVGMLALPDCGRVRMQLMRSRTLQGAAFGNGELLEPGLQE